MKVVFKSFYLFFLGISADALKYILDRRIARGDDMSSLRLTKISDNCCRLYVSFERLENELTAILRCAKKPELP